VFTWEVYLILLLLFVLGLIYNFLGVVFARNDALAQEEVDADMGAAFSMSMWMGQD
tara:strand:+ start:1281 stop:1448 length:168 start_codon:yes stop_codon:yes gene_type:complete